jgi:hypothetical protein
MYLQEEGSMSSVWILRRSLQAAGVVAMFTWLGSVHAAGPDPKVLSFKLPDQIPWVTNPNGADQAVLYGDPSKPGLYIVLDRWHAGHMSRPHFHPNDRFIYVISGTWWVGTGPKYDPSTTTPMPAGSFVTHYGKEIHWDGAKEGDCVIEIVGMGPATATQAEQK